METWSIPARTKRSKPVRIPAAHQVPMELCEVSSRRRAAGRYFYHDSNSATQGGREYRMTKVLITLIAGSLLLLVPSLQISHADPQAGEFKTLSADEIQGLRNGEGMGAAKAAELNHYPGPRHVLDFASQLQLSEEQRNKTQAIYDRMHEEAVRLGKTILQKEEELDNLFKKNEVESKKLKPLVREIARLRGELRLVHLLAHLEMKRVLSRGQIEKYDDLQGYGTTEPIDKHHHHEKH